MLGTIQVLNEIIKEIEYIESCSDKYEGNYCSNTGRIIDMIKEKRQQVFHEAIKAQEIKDEQLIKQYNAFVIKPRSVCEVEKNV